MERLKRAIIVAAGIGKRLQPLTLEIPKPLVPVNGVRMTDTQIRALKEHGIHEIYIVTGYMEEKFREAYADDPEIRFISNPYYLQGNNITSLYMAREYLPGAFVLEGDLMVRNADIFDPLTDRSGYCATWMEHAPEWALKLADGRIASCEVDGADDAWRLWGISFWTEKDGLLLSELLRKQFEEIRDWSVYWDNIALWLEADRFDLGVREVPADALMEIDSLAELAEIDPSYRSYLKSI